MTAGTKLLVTGGCGFIGSAVTRLALEQGDHAIVNVDRLTYAAAPEALSSHREDSRLVHEPVDVCDPAAVRRVFAQHRPDAVLHLAAESHVDRSIEAPSEFVRTNVLGTHTMLAAARDYWSSLPSVKADRFRFVQVSTDEVFGSRPPGEYATEATRYAPGSPYAGSKAAADQLAWSYRHTFGLPLVVTHSCNNYGPWQYPEKLVPVAVVSALEGQPIPVYGSGENMRDWLHVDDHARALLRVIEAGAPGTAYGISAGNVRSNIALVRALCNCVDAIAPNPGGRRSFELVHFVADRPGHDHHYGLTSERIRAELGWSPRIDLDSGLAHTVEWYRDNLSWCRQRLARPVTDTNAGAI